MFMLNSRFGDAYGEFDLNQILKNGLLVYRESHTNKKIDSISIDDPAWYMLRMKVLRQQTWSIRARVIM